MQVASCCRVALGCMLSGGAFWLSLAVAAEPETSARAKEVLAESGRLERHRNEFAARERQAAEALQSAERALSLATKANNQDAIPIAEQAVAVSRNALSDARARRETAQRQLDDRLRLLGRSDAPNPRVIGALTDSTGPVFIRTRLGLVAVAPDFVFREGDEIETGEKGRAVFTFDEGGWKVMVGEKSAFKLRERAVRAGILDQARGILRLWANCLKMECRYRIAFSGGVAAVRGTDFETDHSSGGTTVRVFQGKVEVTPEGGAAINVEKGHRLTVYPDGKMDGPAPMNPAEAVPRVSER